MADRGNSSPCDVFISYPRRDRGAVEPIANALRDPGLSVVWDRWYLVPGRSRQKVLAEKTRTCRAMPVCAGPEGLGRWQQREKELALDRQTRDDAFSVIPVLLPGAEPALGFLGLNTWVDLRSGVDDPTQLDILELAVRGEAPGPDIRERMAATLAAMCPYGGLQPGTFCKRSPARSRSVEQPQ